MVNLSAITEHVVNMLDKGLSKSLTYHNTHHTLDVTAQCRIIASGEGIVDQQILLELQIAALYHDTGFLVTYHNHEEESCIIARKQLPGYGIPESAIDHICELIMATKVPQMPRNHLQKIICDADLDYLGRADFFETGMNLYLELIKYNLIDGEHDWEERQLFFLQNHRYFTGTSQQKREPAKLKFVQQLLHMKNTATK